LVRRFFSREAKIFQWEGGRGGWEKTSKEKLLFSKKLKTYHFWPAKIPLVPPDGNVGLQAALVIHGFDYSQMQKPQIMRENCHF
jgi:hypothetical protein